VEIRRIDTPRKRISFGDGLHFDVAVKLNGLRPEDVTVELLICRQFKKTKLRDFEHFKFGFMGVQEAGEDMFALDLTPGLCGKLEYYIRVYPCHPLLTHPFEMGMMVWL
jgi:starch phosphorylase